MKTSYFLVLLFIIPVLGACQPGKNASGKKPADTSNAAGGETVLAINQCHIKAKINYVYRNESQALSGDVCDSLPCMADIEILEVISSGQGFPAALNAKDVLSAHFPFSLKPTDKLFPDMQPPLPGLEVGDTVITNLEARMIMGGGFEFYVFDYKKETKP